MATSEEALSHIAWSIVTNRIFSRRVASWLAGLHIREREAEAVVHIVQLPPPTRAPLFPEHMLSIFLFGHPEFWNPLAVSLSTCFLFRKLK